MIGEERAALPRLAATPAPATDDGGLGRLLSRASLAGAGTLVQQGLAFVSGLLVARVLGAAEFGVFNLARNLTDIAGVVTRLGLDIGLQRLMGAASAPEDRVAQAALLRRLRLLAAAVAAVPALAVALGAGALPVQGVYGHPRFAATLFWLALALPFLTDIAVLGGAYRGVLRLAPAVLTECVLLPAIRLLAIVVLFLAGWRLWAVVAASLFAPLVASRILAASARRDFPAGPATARADWGAAFAVIRYSGVLSAAVLVTLLTASLDLLLLGHFSSAEQTGQYALVKTLLMTMGLVGFAVGQGLGALVAERHARGDRAAVVSVIARSARWTALGTVPVFAVFLFWGSELTRLFGPTFDAPPPVIALLAIGQYGVALLGQAGWALSMTGRHVAELAVLCAGLVAACVLGLVAVPAWGQLGAAATTLIAVGVANAGRLLLVRRSLGRLPFAPDLLVITLSGVAIAGLAWLLAARLPLPETWRAACGMAVFLPAYGICAWHALLADAERRELRRLLLALPGPWRRGAA